MNKNELIIGSHVGFTSNKQLLGSVEEALSYEANTFMFYTGAPQNTKRSPINDELTYLLSGIKSIRCNKNLAGQFLSIPIVLPFSMYSDIILTASLVSSNHTFSTPKSSCTGNNSFINNL